MAISTGEKAELKIKALEEALGKALYGKEEVIRFALCAFFSRGHLLIEDVPGMGKTRLAYALSQVMSLSFSRIQFTSDMLPSDILGATIFSTRDQNFIFKKGPIFSNVVLADELNRTPPKTQSALLEAMNERQISIEGKTFPLPEPFFVIATQNPSEFYGTYPLPESQLDRFALRLTIGYPDKQAERKILEEKTWLDEKPELPVILSKEEVLALQDAGAEVTVHEKVLAYIMELVRQTREDSRIWLGVSPRGAKSFLLSCKALAFISGRSFVSPDDVKKLFIASFAHRLTLREAGFSKDPFSLIKAKEQVLEAILQRVPVPR